MSVHTFARLGSYSDCRIGPCTGTERTVWWMGRSTIWAVGLRPLPRPSAVHKSRPDQLQQLIRIIKRQLSRRIT